MRLSLLLLFVPLLGLLQAISSCVGDDSYSSFENSSIPPIPSESITEDIYSPTTSPDEGGNYGDDDGVVESPPSSTVDLISPTSSATVPPTENTIDNSWIVVLKNTKGSQTTNHIKWIQGVSTDKADPSQLFTNYSTFGKFGWYSGNFTNDTLNKLNDSAAVDYLVRDVEFKTVNTQQNPPSWGLSRISQRNLPLNNKYIYPEFGGENVTVYVIDTGCNLKHNDLQNRATFGAAFLGNRTDDKDTNGHGTFVAGIITGKKYGVAKKAKVVCVRALQPDGAGRLSVVLQAIDWATKQHQNSTYKKSIINLSLGAEFNQATNDAIKSAMDLGIHFSIAAGNEGGDACKFSPASVQGALTVGAINSDDTIASYSNTGRCVDIYAPGTNIISIWNTSKSATRTLSGTSMASPHVAGVMAILLSTGNYTPPELVKKIKDLATTFNAEKYPPLLLYNVYDEHIAAIQNVSGPPGSDPDPDSESDSDSDSAATFLYPGTISFLGIIVALVIAI